jgi:hypothetical protein
MRVIARVRVGFDVRRHPYLGGELPAVLVQHPGNNLGLVVPDVRRNRPAELWVCEHGEELRHHFEVRVVTPPP